jgi:hypothetical protein
MDHEKTSAFHLENPGNAKPAKRESPQAGDQQGEIRGRRGTMMKHARPRFCAVVNVNSD